MKTAMSDALERSGYYRMNGNNQNGDRMNKGNNDNGGYKDKKAQSSKPKRFCQTYMDKEKKYFLDKEKKQIDPKFVDEHAQAIARLFARRVKITQIRGFYNTVCRINRKLNENQMAEVDYRNVKAHVDILKAHAENKRKNGLVTDDFVDFIETNVDAVKGKEDLKAFKMHFEAILGYMPKDAR